MVNFCKNTCTDHERGSRSKIYFDGGCYCSICEYYFQERMLKCPCCSTATRHRSRSNRRLADQPPRIV